MSGLTPIYQFPYVQGTDQAREFPATHQALAEGVEAALLQTGNPPVGSDLESLLRRVNALENDKPVDTGWLNITPTRAGVTLDPTEPARARMVGGVVFVAGQFNYTSGPGNGVFGYLPDGIPAPSQRFILAGYNTNRYIVDVTGSIAFNIAVSANSYVRLDGGSWPA